VSNLITIDELQVLIDNTKWSFLGRGQYNNVVISKDILNIEGFSGRWVVKTPRKGIHLLSEADRAIRKWRELNPTYPVFRTIKGWMAPYLGNTPASDEQIAEKIIDIYRHTRNIVADAAAKGNFVLYNGDVVCIDMDHAFRRGSFASNLFMSIDDKDYKCFLRSCSEDGKPITVSVIKTLYYLEEQLDTTMLDNKYLSIKIIDVLHDYRRNKLSITIDILDAILDLINLDSDGKLNLYFIPSFIEIVKNARKHQTIITKELLEDLIYDALIDYSTPSQIITVGNLSDIKILINHDRTLLNKVDANGFTLLHIAAMLEYSDIVSYLLDEGAEINTLTIISGYNSFPIPMTALDLAIYHEKQMVADLLFDKGASFTLAINDKFEFLIFAARRGLIEQLISFVERNPESVHQVDESNQTALLWAAYCGQNECVRYLISKGANINRATITDPDNEDCQHENNRSPLDWAIVAGHTSTIDLLISAGGIANITTPEEGKNAIVKKRLNRYALFSLITPASTESEDEDIDRAVEEIGYLASLAGSGLF